MGLFDDIVKIQGQVGKVEDSLAAAANDPIVMAVKTGIKLLPEGGVKDWFSKNPVDFWKSIIQIFTGRKYTSNEYRVAERYFDQVVDNGNPDIVTSWRKVPDESVPIAQQLFAMLFGVRINTQEDFDALNVGPNEYYLRAERDDIPRKAVERAVYLKKNFYPDRLFNTEKWNLKWFEKYPLVAPIPSIHYKQLYTGELPGGGYASNGIIEGDGVLEQVLNANPNWDPSIINEDEDGGLLPGVGGNQGLLIAGAVVVGLLLLSNQKSK